MQINEISLFEILSNVKGGTMCAITTLTEPKLTKTGNPYYGKVQKLAVRKNIQFGCDYYRTCEGHGAVDMEREKANGAEVVVENKISVSKGGYRANFYLMKNSTTEVMYLIEGRVATAEETAVIRSFEPIRKPSAKQIAYGVDPERTVATFRPYFSNILSVRVNGVDYEIIHEVEATR